MTDLIEFTGGNGKRIADLMSSFSGQEIIVGEVMDSGALSLDQVRGDQQLPDRWRIPVGCFVNPATGEVSDKDGVVLDYADLVKRNGE